MAVRYASVQSSQFPSIDTCISCHENLFDGREVVAHTEQDLNHLDHPIHKTCLKKWIVLSSTCSLCRKEVDINSVFEFKDHALYALQEASQVASMYLRRVIPLLMAAKGLTVLRSHLQMPIVKLEDNTSKRLQAIAKSILPQCIVYHLYDIDEEVMMQSVDKAIKVASFVILLRSAAARKPLPKACTLASKLGICSAEFFALTAGYAISQKKFSFTKFDVDKHVGRISGFLLLSLVFYKLKTRI